MASSPTRRRLPLVRHRCLTYKVGYPTKADALNAAERMMEQGCVDPGCHITPYFCDRCGEWHVYNRVIVIVEEAS